MSVRLRRGAQKPKMTLNVILGVRGNFHTSSLPVLPSPAEGHHQPRLT